MILDNLKKELKKLAEKEKSQLTSQFFKMGKGEYSEGDIFIGVTVPNCRIIVKKYQTLSSVEIEKLLSSKIHEERLTALMIIVEQFRIADVTKREEIFKFYLNHTKQINNWDLVDLSAYKVVGQYLIEKEKDILYKLAESKDIWERRIAIVSTFAFIRVGKLEDTLEISRILLKDKQDLIQKAVGWMLRELGKKDEKILIKFLKENYKEISRTTLRYAIEKFSEDLRKKYLKGKF